MASEGSKDLPVRSSAETPQDANPSNHPAQAPPKQSDSLPDFIIERNNFFEELWQQYIEELKNRPHPEIKITLDLGSPNPSTIVGKAWETTPAFLLRDVPKDISANAVVAKVDGKELWDLTRPLERDCTVSYVSFYTPEGREVFWHSSAHCLGEACECEYGCLLSHGPPTPQGFFYDMAIPGGYALSIGMFIWKAFLCANATADVLLGNPIGRPSIARPIEFSRTNRALTGWRLRKRT